MQKCDAASIEKAIRDQLNIRGLSYENVIGFGSDGASVMTGSISGVAARLKAANPKIVSTLLCTSTEPSFIPSCRFNSILAEVPEDCQLHLQHDIPQFAEKKTSRAAQSAASSGPQAAIQAHP
ncbi:hypothetical protein HOLleu_00713 [Holothuria leucospilota]|uniref:Uncharacterized protein n=1 Tax=Holothuria leucospilota TaxID=206669 RepID=A0A9Q1CNE3_HOLLE|nr:hypothetical protein HOLleu_00713 [Holothuria leucospilota]